MRLQDWLEREKLTQAAFAKRIGQRPQAVHKYLTGERFPAAEQRRLIYHATGGEVTGNDFDGIAEPQPWLVALAQPDRRGAFLRLGWEPWPACPDGSCEAAESGLMRRKRRPGEGWRELLAELAYLAMIPPPGAPRLDQGALVASGTDPD